MHRIYTIMFKHIFTREIVLTTCAVLSLLILFSSFVLIPMGAVEWWPHHQALVIIAGLIFMMVFYFLTLLFVELIDY